MNTKKEILIGFIVGVIANVFGTLIYVLLFSDLGIAETFNAAIDQGHMGSLLALGAILNLVAFFGFLRIKREHRARGVMIATLVTSLVILFYKVFA
jgi:heme/copper-type cytochrome/quinol oxidase subunit 4